MQGQKWINIKYKRKIFSNFATFLENMNFTIVCVYIEKPKIESPFFTRLNWDVLGEVYVFMRDFFPSFFPFFGQVWWRDLCSVWSQSFYGVAFDDFKGVILIIILMPLQPTAFFNRLCLKPRPCKFYINFEALHQLSKLSTNHNWALPGCAIWLFKPQTTAVVRVLWCFWKRYMALAIWNYMKKWDKNSGL